MKAKELNATNVFYPDKRQFIRLQFTRGLPLSVVGLFVYAFLRLLGRRPKDFHGVCRYFEIGKGWGGFECGWFFVCGKDSSERLMAHELGHGVFNANIGGFRTLFFAFCSSVRYWYRRLFRITTPYDAWWYENTATVCGLEYVSRLDNREETTENTNKNPSAR